VDGARVARAAC